MKLDEIKELVKILEDSSLSLLEIEEGDLRVLMSKSGIENAGGAASAYAQGAEAAAGPAGAVGYGSEPAGSLAAGVVGAKSIAAEVDVSVAGGSADAAALGHAGSEAEGAPAGTPVKAPMVGVFYAAPSPGEPPYVTVGETVEKGRVLCILEAMKLMNEITAEQDGVILKVCAKSGDIVEYGQPLFYIG